MDNYHNSLARDQMIKAWAALEKADEFIALASREDGVDLSFRKSIAQINKKLSTELSRLADVMADQDLSE